MRIKLLVFLFSILTLQFGVAQESDMEKSEVGFMKLVHLQSTEVLNQGDVGVAASFILRSAIEGQETFLDMNTVNANLQIIYGLMDGIHIGVSRESFRKTFAGHIKVALAEQTQEFPLAITAYSNVNLNTQLDVAEYPNLKYGDRLSYATQLLMSRKMGDRITLSVAPTFVRQNLVFEKEQNHEQYALGMGFSYYLTPYFSLNLDYVYNLSRWESSKYTDPLSLGVNYNFRDYVLQLALTNTQSINAPSFVSNAEGDWNIGEVYFGISLTKVF